MSLSMEQRGGPRLQKSPDSQPGRPSQERQQAERLRHARAALAKAEGKENVVTVTQKLPGRSGLGRGVFHLDGTVEGMAQALSFLLEPDQFAAVVAVEDVSWEGVESVGVDISQIVVIRNVNGQGMKVVGSLLEGFAVLVLGPISFTPRQRRALAGRARALNAVILTWEPWAAVTSEFVVPNRSSWPDNPRSNPLLRYRRMAS